MADVEVQRLRGTSPNLVTKIGPSQSGVVWITGGGTPEYMGGVGGLG